MAGLLVKRETKFFSSAAARRKLSAIEKTRYIWRV
jgi:hypothetical protein